MIKETTALPKGFEKVPEQGAVQYRAGAGTDNNKTQTVNFRGRPGGPPGRMMGQTVERLKM